LLEWLELGSERLAEYLLPVLTRLAGRDRAILNRILDDAAHLGRQSAKDWVVEHFIADCSPDLLPEFVGRLDALLGSSPKAAMQRARITALLAPTDSDQRARLRDLVLTGAPTIARQVIRRLGTAIRTHGWWDQELLTDLLSSRTSDAAAQAAMLLEHGLKDAHILTDDSIAKLRSALSRTNDQHLQRAIAEVLLREVRTRPLSAPQVCLAVTDLVEKLVAEQKNAFSKQQPRAETGGFATRIRITIDLLLAGIYSEQLEEEQIAGWVRRLLLRVDLGRARRASNDGERVLTALSSGLRSLLDELISGAPSMPEANQLALARALIAREGRRSEHALRLLKAPGCPPTVQKYLVTHLQNV